MFPEVWPPMTPHPNYRCDLSCAGNCVVLDTWRPLSRWKNVTAKCREQRKIYSDQIKFKQSRFIEMCHSRLRHWVAQRHFCKPAALFSALLGSAAPPASLNPASKYKRVNSTPSDIVHRPVTFCPSRPQQDGCEKKLGAASWQVRCGYKFRVYNMHKPAWYSMK